MADKKWDDGMAPETKAAMVDEMLRRHLEAFPPADALHPDLLPYLRPGILGGEMLHHPLLIELMVDSMTFGRINERYKYAKERLSKAVSECDFEKYVFVHERPYRTEALARLYRSGKLQWSEVRGARLCQSVWIDSENIPENLRFWREAFKRTSGLDWMDDDDKEAFDKLPDVIEVWRGECNDGGYSWTRSEKVARFFANRKVNESTGRVLSGRVDKKKVFAFLIGRNEEEILVTSRRYIKQSS